MKRREFLQAAVAMPALAAMPSAVRETVAAQREDGWRTYEIVTKVEIAKPAGVSRAWIPLPYAARTEWHNPLGNQWTGNGQMKVVKDPKYGAEMLYAEWKEGESAPVAEVTSRFATRDRAVDPTRPNPAARKLSATDVKLNTASTIFIPTDGIVRDTAEAITKGLKTDVEKSRALYEWIVDNTFRDPKVRG